MPMSETEYARFISKTEKIGDCLNFTGCLDKDGYGSFFFRCKDRRAHRVVYWHHFGDIPPKMVVNHVCGNRACVEITHLRLATIRENTLRESNSIPATNARKTHCKNGHPFDKVYGKQRYCSICQRAKHARLTPARKERASITKC